MKNNQLSEDTKCAIQSLIVIVVYILKFIFLVHTYTPEEIFGIEMISTALTLLFVVTVGCDEIYPDNIYKLIFYTIVFSIFCSNLLLILLLIFLFTCYYDE